MANAAISRQTAKEGLQADPSSILRFVRAPKGWRHALTVSSGSITGTKKFPVQ